jgi:tetratricopeptide (TPR) repeat protein
MAEPVKCAACGRAFNAAFKRCPFCNATAPPPAAPTRIDFSAVAEQAIALNRPLLELEFHPAAVAAVDAFFELTWGPEGKAPQDDAWQPTTGQRNVIISFGAFLGELLRREFGGAWKDDPAQPDNPYAARVVLPGGIEVFPISKVFRRLQNGRAEVFEPLHRLVREKLGAQAAPAEIPGWLRQAKHLEGVGRPDLAVGFYERALALGPSPAQRTPIEGQLAAAREKARVAESEAEAAAVDETPRSPAAAAPSAPATGGPPPAPARPPESAATLPAPAPVTAPPPAKDPAARLAEIEQIEDVGQAVEAYARFNAEHPELAEPWRERGVGLTMLGRGEEALACFDRAAELEPGEPKSYDHKAVTLTRLGRVEDAVRTLDEGLRHCPGSGTLLMRRGVFLTRLDRNDEAMRAFDEAIRVDPEYPETWAFKGDLEQHLGRVAEAIASLRHYLSAKGDSQEKRVLAARRQLQALEEAGPPPGRRPA